MRDNHSDNALPENTGDHTSSNLSTSPNASTSAISRDTGTFRATTPELGGFLDSNGNPVDTSNHLDDTALATQKGHDLPMLEDKEPGMRTLWPAIWVFAAVILVIVLVIIFLLQNAAGPSIGDADNLMEIFIEPGE